LKWLSEAKLRVKNKLLDILTGSFASSFYLRYAKAISGVNKVDNQFVTSLAGVNALMNQESMK
jgi:hypothetical protein